MEQQIDFSLSEINQSINQNACPVFMEEWPVLTGGMAPVGLRKGKCAELGESEVQAHPLPTSGEFLHLATLGCPHLSNEDVTAPVTHRVVWPWDNGVSMKPHGAVPGAYTASFRLTKETALFCFPLFLSVCLYFLCRNSRRNLGTWISPWYLLGTK